MTVSWLHTCHIFVLLILKNTAFILKIKPLSTILNFSLPLLFKFQRIMNNIIVFLLWLTTHRCYKVQKKEKTECTIRKIYFSTFRYEFGTIDQQRLNIPKNNLLLVFCMALRCIWADKRKSVQYYKFCYLNDKP